MTLVTAGLFVALCVITIRVWRVGETGNDNDQE